jgi:hypothetical protein
MFLVFTLLMVLNYATDRERFLFAYRFDVFGMPINVLDVLVAIGLVLLPFSWRRRAYATETTHAALKWTVGALVVAWISGTVMGFLIGADVREVVAMGRNVLNLAFAHLLGYAAVSTLSQVKWAGYVILLSSFLSAGAALLFMRDSTETLNYVGSTFHTLRSSNKGGDLGVVGAGFVVFCLVAGLRYMNWLVAAGVLVVCAVGAFSLPHRSSYLVAALTIGFAAVALPPVGIARRLGTSAVTVGALVVVLSMSAVAYSRASGRNFDEYVKTRVLSMIPGVDVGHENRPWETRIPGIVAELQMWMTSPVFGRGFGCQNVLAERYVNGTIGFRHNVWTAGLAEGGLPLLAGYLMPCVFSIVIGWRMVKERWDRVTVMIGAIAAMNGLLA